MIHTLFLGAAIVFGGIGLLNNDIYLSLYSITMAIVMLACVIEHKR